MTEREKLLSIDAFRGIAISGMILVNTPGSWAFVWRPLRHAEWNGCTAADMVFPFFLFISGASAAFSRTFTDADPGARPVLRILRRVVVIFALGLFLNAFPFKDDLSSLRLMGVLQRTALSWGLAALALKFLSRRIVASCSALILVLHWIVLFLFGGSAPYSPEGNFARAVDLEILGENHMWSWRGIALEPEGLLGTFPAAVTIVAGFLCGSIMKGPGRGGSKAAKMLLAGAASAVLGAVWSLVFPLNKYLWTGSFVLVTSGAAFIFLSLVFWAADARGFRRWAIPAAVFGMNPIFIFLISSIWSRVLLEVIRTGAPDGSEVSGHMWIYGSIFVPAAGKMLGSLLFSLAHILFFWVILYPFYRKRVRIRI